MLKIFFTFHNDYIASFLNNSRTTKGRVSQYNQNSKSISKIHTSNSNSLGYQTQTIP